MLSLAEKILFALAVVVSLYFTYRGVRRIVAQLSGGRNYVSQLAREIRMSRPLLHMHLQKLEAAGLIAGHLELSEEGKAMKYYELTPFALTLDAATIARLAESLPDSDSKGD